MEKENNIFDNGDLLFDVSRLDLDDPIQNAYHLDNICDMKENMKMEKHSSSHRKKVQILKPEPVSPSLPCQANYKSAIPATNMEISRPVFCNFIQSSLPIPVFEHKSLFVASRYNDENNELRCGDNVNPVTQYTNSNTNTSTIDNIRISYSPSFTSTSTSTSTNRYECDSYELTQLSPTCLTMTTNSSFTSTSASSLRIPQKTIQIQGSRQKHEHNGVKLATSYYENNENDTATVKTTTTTTKTPKSGYILTYSGNINNDGEYSPSDSGHFSAFVPASVSTPESYLYNNRFKKSPQSLSPSPRLSVSLPPVVGTDDNSKSSAVDHCRSSVTNTIIENIENNSSKSSISSRDFQSLHHNYDAKLLVSPTSSYFQSRDRCSGDEKSINNEYRASLISSEFSLSSTSNDARATCNRFETVHCSNDHRSKLCNNNTSNNYSRNHNDGDDDNDDSSRLFASLLQSRVQLGSRSFPSSGTRTPEIDGRSHSDRSFAGFEPADLQSVASRRDELYEALVKKSETRYLASATTDDRFEFKLVFEQSKTETDEQSSTSIENDEKQKLKNTAASSTTGITASTSAFTVSESFRPCTNFTERKRERREKYAHGVALPTLFESEQNKEKGMEIKRLVDAVTTTAVAAHLSSSSPRIDSGSRSCNHNHNYSQHCLNFSNVETTLSRRQPLYLNRGKKWRRSFITLKNIRENVGGNINVTSFLFQSHKNDNNDERQIEDTYARTSYVGQCWRKNVENSMEKQQTSVLFRDDTTRKDSFHHEEYSPTSTCTSTSSDSNSNSKSSNSGNSDNNNANNRVRCGSGTGSGSGCDKSLQTTRSLDGGSSLQVQVTTPTRTRTRTRICTRDDEEENATKIPNTLNDTVVRRRTIRFSTRIVLNRSAFNDKTRHSIIATAFDCNSAFSSWWSMPNDDEVSFSDGSTLTAIVGNSTVLAANADTKTADATIAAITAATDCGGTKTNAIKGWSHSVSSSNEYSYNTSTTVANIPRLDLNATRSAREIVLRYCKQIEPLPFKFCFTERVLKNCKKIGEGVYGEVFALNQKTRPTVLKIIPIEGEKTVNGEKQKTYEEILSELVIALELANLKRRKDYSTNNFAEVRRCCVVYGTYSQRLIDLWKIYDRQKGSDNESPIIFEDNQLYMIIEFNHGGQDLESFKFNNARQALSVFKQVAHALAIAEEALMFEHRDLHWGNVLVLKTQKRNAHFVRNGENYKFGLCGVKVTIIDYTLSRISINNRTLYNDIGRDPELFTAEGDFQFEVYRLMREQVDNVWDRFVPKTNVLWLSYLLDKIIHEVQFIRNESRLHSVNMDILRSLFVYGLTKFASCVHLVQSGLVD